MTRTVYLALVLVLAGILAGGCGYHHGRLRHPQVRTVAVGSVENDTDRPWLTSLLRQKLQRALTVQGAYQLADSAAADAIVDVRVVDYQQTRRAARRIRTAANNDETYTTTVFGLTVTVEYSLHMRGQTALLVPPTRVEGKGEFEQLGDLETARAQAFEIALADAAGQVAVGIAEAW